MQRRLVVLRHGHAESHNDDFERQLSDDGRAEAQAAGARLASDDFRPELVLSSPAPRALETAEIVARACGYRAVIDTRRELYLAPQTQYLETLRALGAVSQVLLVGHNPGLSGLARRLSPNHGGLAPAEYVSLELELAHWRELGR